MQPFNYPYPTVSIIPNQYDYFNVPFPIVYGCLKNQAHLLKEKVTKTYKNVYIFINPSGIQIHSHKNLTKILNRKSAKLRDKLLPEFIKINKLKEEKNRKNTSKLSFISWFAANENDLDRSEDKKNKFLFQPNNHEIAATIIKKINNFMNEIKANFPDRNLILKLRKDFEKQAK